MNLMQKGSMAPKAAFGRRWSGWSVADVSCRKVVARASVEKDLDWEPTMRAPSAGPARGGGAPPPPPPPPPRPPPAQPGFPAGPFASRRNIALTALAGSAGLWVINHKLGPVEFADRPDINFRLLGFTDVDKEDFVYFKTPGGNWVASAVDQQGRVYMVDELGDLYYDSGDPEVGMYMMDTDGNLYNRYLDTDGQRKITPVGNVGDLQRFNISEVAGIKLDRDVNVVAFKDGRTLELPAGSGYVDENGEVKPPLQIYEGVEVPKENPFAKLFGDSSTRDYPLDRMEVDLNDSTPIERQLFDQILLDDPDLPGFQPALPEGFDIKQLAKEVEKEARRKK